MQKRPQHGGTYSQLSSAGGYGTEANQTDTKMQEGSYPEVSPEQAKFRRDIHDIQQQRMRTQRCHSAVSVSSRDRLTMKLKNNLQNLEKTATIKRVVLPIEEVKTTPTQPTATEDNKQINRAKSGDLPFITGPDRLNFKEYVEKTSQQVLLAVTDGFFTYLTDPMTGKAKLVKIDHASQLLNNNVSPIFSSQLFQASPGQMNIIRPITTKY